MRTLNFRLREIKKSFTHFELREILGVILIF